MACTYTGNLGRQVEERRVKHGWILVKEMTASHMRLPNTRSVYCANQWHPGVR